MKQDKQHFLKESQVLIRYCKMESCRKSIKHPEKDDFKLGLCDEHRKQYHSWCWQTYGKDWLKNQPEEVRAEYARKKFLIYKKWVEKNPERRREIALKSYHKNSKKANARRREVYRQKKNQA